MIPNRHSHPAPSCRPLRRAETASPDFRASSRRTRSRNALIAAMLVAAISLGSGKDYYLDSTSKPDGDGSKRRLWNRLDAISKVGFRPGDRILFARGSQFRGGGLWASLSV